MHGGAAVDWSTIVQELGRPAIATNQGRKSPILMFHLLKGNKEKNKWVAIVSACCCCIVIFQSQF